MGKTLAERDLIVKRYISLASKDLVDLGMIDIERILYKVIDDVADIDPPQEPPEGIGPLVLSCVNALISDMIDDLDTSFDDFIGAWYHYINMYRAYRHGEEPTIAEKARALTLAWANGRAADKIKDSDSAQVLVNLLYGSVAAGVSSPRVWLEKPDWLGRRDRPMQNSDQYWVYVGTGGSGGTWSGPPTTPK